MSHLKMESEELRLQVVGRYCPITHIVIKRGTKLKKLMDVYCENQGLSRNEVIFYFNKAKLKDDGTCLSLNIEDEDTIRVIQKMESEESIIIQVLRCDYIKRFVIKRSTELKHLMDRYCELETLPREYITFCFKGSKVRNDDTSLSMGIEIGDTILVYWR